MTSVLFLVQFENFDQTTGFYWSYMLTLQVPVLMRSCITVSLISLPHSLLSPHSLVRCVLGRVPRILENPLRAISSAAQNVSIALFWVICSTFSAYIAQMLWQMRLLRFILHVCWEVWLARIYVSLLCRRETFKIRWTCNTEGSIFQNLTRKHTPGTLLQGKAPCKPIIYFLDTHVCPLLVTTALCEEEET